MTENKEVRIHTELIGELFNLIKDREGHLVSSISDKCQDIISVSLNISSPRDPIIEKINDALKDYTATSTSLSPCGRRIVFMILP